MVHLAGQTTVQRDFGDPASSDPPDLDPKSGPKPSIWGSGPPNVMFVIDSSPQIHDLGPRNRPILTHFGPILGPELGHSGASQDPGIPLYGSSMVPEGLPEVPIWLS